MVAIPAIMIDEKFELVKEEEEYYQFRDVNTKIAIQEQMKKQTNTTRKIWSYLQKKGFHFHGVVRDYTAIFSNSTHYLVIHHFIEKKPRRELMGERSPYLWGDVLIEDEEFPICLFLYGLERFMGFRSYLPEQVYLDAFEQSMIRKEVDWHLHSPKHKLLVWMESEEVTLLVETYFNHQSLPPYGVKDPLEWPNLELEREFEQYALFDFPSPIENEPPTSFSGITAGEFMGIEEELRKGILEETEKAIDRIFREQNKVVCAWSGGKDSSVILQICTNYLLNHPEYQDKFYIISANTTVENPLIYRHIQSMKKAVVGHLNAAFEKGFSKDRFIIVEPDPDQTYVVNLFGKAYAPPSAQFKHCVRRLKIDPARKVLSSFVQNGENVCQILGVRESESTTRGNSVRNHYGEDEFYGLHDVQGIRTAAPIRQWTATDVATYLVQVQPIWWKEYSNYQLINLYGHAAGQMECPIGAMISNENDAIKGCSGSSARFGCWACTVISEDISLKNLVATYDELGPYYEMRQILKEAQDIRYGGMTGYQRKRTFGVFEPGIGDLTIDIRTILLKHWKRLEIPMAEEDVMMIDTMVKDREIKEGIAISNRFRDALYALLPVHPGVISSMNHPIWDPWGCGVDRFTQEDIEVLTRLGVWNK
ncbi:phosphoadenosine phosphosulfate reductase family protein [Ammoniphilus resinae]|uniref:DNA sulfur modification protein DndC n=1 Tax=Ammoniphilus resinae TaxID=861532 RepID=A0ABS4GP74_9BACL|nr:phosphoadenosine phosphosulfate reductase family protein [Ammoniphilus resinae]MBP1932046.1 DNA sulfur modification protein DndC [Ammoniphilus resinae]